MEIRRAEPAEAAELSLIARRAKAHWGYPAAWLERWQEQLTITPEFIAINEVFAARLGDRAAGFHALLKTSQAMRLEHLWVIPELMSRGIGRALFGHATARAASLGASSLTIEADPNAEAFYLHLGAIRTGSSRTEIEGELRELPLLTVDCRDRF